MTIHDDTVNLDKAIADEVSAVIASIKDDLARLTTLLSSLDVSSAARKVEVDRVNPIVAALQALNLP